MDFDEISNSVSVQADEFNESVAEPIGVLETDHPLLEKFQQALKAHLLRVQQQLTDEIDELNHKLKGNDEEAEEIGSRLYDLQEQIEVQKETLDSYNKQILDLASKRQEVEQNVSNYKKEFEEKNSEFKDVKRAYNERLQEIDNLTILESEFCKWTREIKDEIAVAKRVASKDTKDQMAVAEEKRKMDFLLFNLDSEVRRRERELEDINEQIKDQEDATELINRSLADSNSDLEVLQGEHKRLFQSWGEVIIAIQQRDKVLAKTKEELQ